MKYSPVKYKVLIITTCFWFISFSFIFIFHFLFYFISVFIFTFFILNLDKKYDMISSEIVTHVTKHNFGHRVVTQIIVTDYTIIWYKEEYKRFQNK